jgi:hypothetical protein
MNTDCTCCSDIKKIKANVRPQVAAPIKAKAKPKVKETNETKPTTTCNVKVAHIRPKHQNLKVWMEDPNNVYIGRQGIVFVPTDSGKERCPKKASIWANPFKVSKKLSREESIELYEEHIRTRLLNEPELLEELFLLKGKNLGCWCKPEACHGDVLLKLLKEME